MLPAYSRKYACLPRYDSFLQGPGSYSDSFFTPSYLHNSRYISRLDAAHRAKLAAQHRDPAVPAPSNALSASSSHPNLHRMAPSHRGMTYDIIEKEPVSDDDLMPLPTRWDEQNKYTGLELSNDGLEVRYTGPVNRHDNNEAASVRADHPMPPCCGIYYFEITIQSKPKEGYVVYTV